MAFNKILCEVEQCQMAFSINYSGECFEYFFNLNVQLSDQTGTLLEARLTEQTAERIFKLKPAQYLQLNNKELEQLKWSYLMDYHEVKLFIKKPNILRKKLIVLIVDMRPIDIQELSKYISAF